MATLDNSPSLFLGQPWTAWADRLPIQDREAVDGAELEHSHGEKEVVDRRGVMRLRREDMTLFGICPSKDDFYLAVCEHCGHVVKPQALQKHMELRHANSPNLPTPTASPIPVYSAISPSISNGSSNSPGHTTDAISSRVQTQSDNVKLKDVTKMIATAKTATVRAATPTARTPSPVKLTSTPPSTPKTMTPQIKKNHTVPVVKVERSPQAQAELINLKKAQTLAGTTTSNTSNSSVSSSSNSKTGNANTNSNNAKSSSGNTATSGGGSSKKASPRKLLPCKDREFDANKHCGVWINDIQKHCTRSLTCKTHALSLRRAVQGRRKPFDELLAEHRARREKELQLANQAKLQQQQQKQQQLRHQQPSQTSHDNQSGKSSDDGVTKTASPPKTSNLSSHPPKRPLSSSSQSGSSPRQSSSQAANAGQQQQLSSSQASETRTASDCEYDASDDLDSLNCPFINHHPKPAAMCTFGARLMGRGCYVFNRKFDCVRSSVMSLVERHLHPPPFKKLCVPNKSSATGTQAVPVEYMNSQSISPAISAVSGKMSAANGPLLNKSQNLNKKSKPSNKQSSKSKDAHPTSKPKVRRKSGGGGGGSGVIGNNSGINPGNVMPSLTNPGPVTIPLSSGNAAGFNLNATAYTDMGQGIVSGGTGNLIKDLSIVVTNIDANVNSGLAPAQVINGVSNASGQMLTSTGQLVASGMSGQISTVGTATQQLSSSAPAATHFPHTGLQLHAGLPIASLNAGSINIATNVQGGIINTIGEAKLANPANAKMGSASKNIAKARSKGAGNKQSSLARAHTAWQSSSNINRTDAGLSYDTSSNGPSSAQPSPSSISTTPSPHFRPGSVSPQMSVQSPLSNGFIPSPSAVSIKSFPVSSINHFPTISPSRTSTPSPITSSTEASPNSSGHFTSMVFTPTSKSSSCTSAASRANTNFQKQIHKQQPSSVVAAQQLQPQLQLQQQHPPQITASIVAATQPPGKTLQLANSTLMPGTHIFPNMQQLQQSGLLQEQGKAPPLTLQQMTIRLPIQQGQTLTLPQQSMQQKTLDHKQALLGQTDKPV